MIMILLLVVICVVLLANLKKINGILGFFILLIPDVLSLLFFVDKVQLKSNFVF